MAEGYGRLEMVDGYKYEGEWAHDLPNGRGMEVNGVGEQYKGEFVMGRKFGNGVYKWVDGTQYMGGFYDDMPNGTDKFI